MNPVHPVNPVQIPGNAFYRDMLARMPDQFKAGTEKTWGPTPYMLDVYLNDDIADALTTIPPRPWQVALPPGEGRGEGESPDPQRTPIWKPDSREREIINWLNRSMGRESDPLRGIPGDWRQAYVTVHGWRWFGFRTQELLDRFFATFPQPDPQTVAEVQTA